MPREPEVIHGAEGENTTAHVFTPLRPDRQVEKGNTLFGINRNLTSIGKNMNALKADPADKATNKAIVKLAQEYTKDGQLEKIVNTHSSTLLVNYEPETLMPLGKNEMPQDWKSLYDRVLLIRVRWSPSMHADAVLEQVSRGAKNNKVSAIKGVLKEAFRYGTKVWRAHVAKTTQDGEEYDEEYDEEDDEEYDDVNFEFTLEHYQELLQLIFSLDQDTSMSDFCKDYPFAYRVLLMFLISNNADAEHPTDASAVRFSNEICRALQMVGDPSQCLEPPDGTVMAKLSVAKVFLLAVMIFQNQWQQVLVPCSCCGGVVSAWPHKDNVDFLIQIAQGGEVVKDQLVARLCEGCRVDGVINESFNCRSVKDDDEFHKKDNNVIRTPSELAKLADNLHDADLNGDLVDVFKRVFEHDTKWTFDPRFQQGLDCAIYDLVTTELYNGDERPVDAITFALVQLSDENWTVMVGASGNGRQYQDDATPTPDEKRRFLRLGAVVEWPRGDDGQLVDASVMLDHLFRRDYVWENPNALQVFHRVDFVPHAPRTIHRFEKECDEPDGVSFHYFKEPLCDGTVTRRAVCRVVELNVLTYKQGSLEDELADGISDASVRRRMRLLADGRQPPPHVIDTDTKLENVPPVEEKTQDSFDYGGFVRVGPDPYCINEYPNPITGRRGGEVCLKIDEGLVFKGHQLQSGTHCAGALKILLVPTGSITKSTTNDADSCYATPKVIAEIVEQYVSMNNMGTLSPEYIQKVISDFAKDRVSNMCRCVLDGQIAKIVVDYGKDSFFDLIAVWPTLAIVLLVDALLLQCTKTRSQLKELLQIICSKFCSCHNQVYSQILCSALATGHYGRVTDDENGNILNACDSNGGFWVELPPDLLNRQQQVVNEVFENPQAVEVQNKVRLFASMHTHPVSAMYDPKYEVQNELIGLNVIDRDGEKEREFSPTMVEEQGLNLLVAKAVVGQQPQGSRDYVVTCINLLAVLLRRDVGQPNEFVLQDQPHTGLQEFWTTMKVSLTLDPVVETIGSIFRNTESGKLADTMLQFISNDSTALTADLEAPFQQIFRSALHMFNKADFCKDDDPFYLNTEAYINFNGKLIGRMLDVLQRLDLKRSRENDSE